MYHRPPANPTLDSYRKTTSNSYLKHGVRRVIKRVLCDRFCLFIGLQKTWFGDCIAHRTTNLLSVHMYHRSPTNPTLDSYRKTTSNSYLKHGVRRVIKRVLCDRFCLFIGLQKTWFGDCIAHRVADIKNVHMYHRSPDNPTLDSYRKATPCFYLKHGVRRG